MVVVNSVVAILATVLSVMGGAAFAQENPPRAISELVTTLKFTQWEQVQVGLDARRLLTSSGIGLIAFRIDPKEFDFTIGFQDSPKGSTAREIGEVSGASLAINAGFFAARENGDLYSVGYLRSQGRVISKGWKNVGGIISFTLDGLELSASHAGIPNNDNDALQSKPMLIEPGGIWAMNTNGGSKKFRSIVCQMPSGEVIVAAIVRGGLSLYEAGWLFRTKDEGGYFGCDAAIALDGGRSTQVWFADDQKYSHSGQTVVNNFLLVTHRQD